MYRFQSSSTFSPRLRGLLTRPLISAAIIGLSLPCVANAGELRLTVEDVRVATGHVMVEVLGSQEQFDGNSEAVGRFMIPASEGTMTLTVTLPPGTYGVRVLHDANGNGELDTNMLGIPREPYAFSNNALGKFGPPEWSGLTFEIGAEGADQPIRLNH